MPDLSVTDCRPRPPVSLSPAMRTTQGKWLALLVCCGVVSTTGCGKKDKEKPREQAETTPAPKTPKPPPPPRSTLPPDSGEHTGKTLWAKGLGSLMGDEGRAVALNAAGDVAVAGMFGGPIDFGNGTAITPQGTDGFLAVYDPDGNYKWATAIGGEGNDIAAAVEFDHAGNVVVGGWFSGEMTIGDIPLKGAGADDIFLAKFDPDGKVKWARNIGSDNIELIKAIAVNADDSLIITGEIRGTIRFDTIELKSAGDADIFLAKLDAKGAVVWAKRFGSTGQDYGRAVAVDSRGDIVLGAEFSGTVDFGGKQPLTHVGNRDALLAKYDADGNYVWAKGWGSSFNDLAVDVAVDPADNVIVVGSFEDKLDLAGVPLTSAGTADAYIAKFSPDGVLAWAKSYGADNNDRADAVGVDKFGNILFAGWFWYKVDFGGGALESPNRNIDIFVVKLSPAGDHLWSRRFGDKDHDRAFGIAVAPDGGSVVTGRFRFAPDFGTGPIQANQKPDNRAPPTDIFVARLAP